MEPTTMSGNLWQRVGSRLAALGRGLWSHAADPALPDVSVNSGDDCCHRFQ